MLEHICKSDTRKMDKKKNQCCAAPECTQCFDVEKRHFFRFPKEHDRWLQWVRACGRPDLEPKGPEYAYHNCRLCHLHFEDKWYNVSKVRAYLHPDAIPTRFFGTPFDKKSTINNLGIMNSEDNENPDMDIEMEEEEIERNIRTEQKNTRTGEKQNRTEGNKTDITRKISQQAGDNNGSISSKTSSTSKGSNLQEQKLRMKIMKLQAQNKSLKEAVRRLRKEKQQKKLKDAQSKEENKANDYETLRQLSRKLLPPKFAQILMAQIDTQIKSKRGLRYDPEFKKIALSLYFLSPRNYKELQKLMTLPSVRSLQLFTQSWEILPGINNKIFNALNMKLNSLSPVERHCILCADEMSLKAHLFYNVSRDEIIGFEDIGNNKKATPAKSALVIMARSIAGNWKIPVCFCFVETACSSKVLKNIIFQIIVTLKHSGVKVHALVTDMGSNFVMLSRELGISTENSMFLVEEEKVFYIFDTPHLIKATRNNLLKHDFQINNKIASWAHIVDFYKKDSKQWIKLAPKLIHSHIAPTNFEKMKVKYAVQIFSNRVAAGMCTQMSSGLLPTEVIGTIDVIDHFDKLFDILNSSSAFNPKEYGKVFVGDDKQIQFLEDMLSFLKCIKVLNVNGSFVTVKCFECWQITIKSVMQLWEILKSYDFPYLRTRRLNQDCVENFFGSVRQQGGNCLNPTPIQFARAFKKLFGLKFLEHSDSQNCMHDTDEMLHLFEMSHTNESTSEFVPSSMHKVLSIPNHDYYSMDLPEKNAFKYVCGFLIKKCTEIHSCNACKVYINESQNILDNTTLYCSFRAYANEDGNLFGNLNIPSDNFCAYVHKLEEIFVKHFESNCFQKNVGGYLFQLAKNISFEPPCPDFPIIFLIKLFLRMRIYYTLSEHNKACKTIPRKNRKLLNISHL